MKASILVAAGLLVALGTTASQAEDGFYAGFGVGGGWAESFAFSGGGGDSSAGVLALLGFTAGVRHDMDNLFVGAEIDGDVSVYDMLENGGLACSSYATGSYYCSHDATLRARAILGLGITDGVEIFGTAGVGVMGGQAATNFTTTELAITSGLTASVGVQVDAGPGKIRGELVYDDFDNNIDPATSGMFDYEPSWSALSAKISYLVSF